MRNLLIKLFIWLLKKQSKTARVGVPYVGHAQCKACNETWAVYAPQGVHKDISMECPECEAQAGSLV